LTDKVVIVVGGASGLGAATAIRLGLEGSRVVVGDIAEKAAHETADRIVTAGGTATAVGFDLANSESVGELVRSAATAFGVSMQCSMSAPICVPLVLTLTWWTSTLTSGIA
jgi:NAD(P)-dependent dehydrogenase (short-subunit alcohol dehydrogenase family)